MKRYFQIMLACIAMLFTGHAGLAAEDAAPNLLVFSHSTGWRHSSIPPGVAALQQLGADRGYVVTASEDPDIFSPGGLDRFDAIVFLSTTTKHDDASSEWFTGSRREALQAFVQRGGGVVGIHAAADSHYSWPWFGELFGARFTSHPPGTPTGSITVVDPDHPSMAGLAPTLERADEWYYFQDYDPTMHLLITLDPASIGEQDVNPNPIAWVHEFEGARVFYTAMGHTDESYADPWFLQHVGQGLDWVLDR